MKSGFNYKEYEKWVERLGIVKEDLQEWLRGFLLEQAQRVITAGKERTPVDTGYLRNSWYIGSQHIEQKENYATGGAEIDWSKSDVANISVIGDYLQVEIGLSADYASYVEYGHHSYQGKYMLTISIDEVQRQLPARFNKEWLQFLKARGFD